jgi:hypothetical protein
MARSLKDSAGGSGNVVADRHRRLVHPVRRRRQNLAGFDDPVRSTRCIGLHDRVDGRAHHVVITGASGQVTVRMSGHEQLGLPRPRRVENHEEAAVT